MVAPQLSDPTQTKTETETSMTNTQIQALSDALQRYFKLMYDCDVSHFDQVFASTISTERWSNARASTKPPISVLAVARRVSFFPLALPPRGRGDKTKSGFSYSFAPLGEG